MSKTHTSGMSTDRLQRVCRSLIEDGGWIRAAASVKMSEQNAYYHLAKSKQTQKRGETESIYLFEFNGETKWFHEHARTCRGLCLYGISHQLIEDLKHGRESIVHSNVDGRPIICLNPLYEHLTQAQFDALHDPIDGSALDPRDRFLFEDAERTRPKYLRRRDPLPASLAQAALRANIEAYKDHQTIDITQRTQVTIMEPAKYVPIAQRAPQPQQQIEDASFTEIAPERDDIAALRRQVEEHLARPLSERVTQPERPVEVFGRAETFKPDKGDQDSVAASRPHEGDQATATNVAVEPQQQEMAPQPSYVRRDGTHNDPTRSQFGDSRRGMKVR